MAGRFSVFAVGVVAAWTISYLVDNHTVAGQAPSTPARFAAVPGDHAAGRDKAPTLAVIGDKDVTAILEITDLIAERVPGARKAIVAGTAHMPSMERPKEFNRLVLEFLDSVQP